MKSLIATLIVGLIGATAILVLSPKESDAVTSAYRNGAMTGMIVITAMVITATVVKD